MSSLSVTKEFQWDMAHMLEGHEGLCKNLHGHTYKLEVTVTSKANRHDATEVGVPNVGMIVDFKKLKDVVTGTIIAPLDHAAMININSADEFEQQLHLLLKQHHKKVYEVPYRPTAENMVVDFAYRLGAELRRKDRSLRVVKLRLYETPTSYAEIDVRSMS